MFGIGFQEMLIILVVVLIFFGPKRLPDLAKSLGKGIAEFKKASDEIRKGIDEAVKEGETAAQQPSADDQLARSTAGAGVAEAVDGGSGPARGGQEPGPAAQAAAGTPGSGHDAPPAAAAGGTDAPSRGNPLVPPSAPAG